MPRGRSRDHVLMILTRDQLFQFLHANSYDEVGDFIAEQTAGVVRFQPIIGGVRFYAESLDGTEVTKALRYPFSVAQWKAAIADIQAGQGDPGLTAESESIKKFDPYDESADWLRSLPDEKVFHSKVSNILRRVAKEIDK